MHIKLTNGQPEIYSIVQLRRDNPQVSFPEVPSDELLASYGVYSYTRPAQLDCDWLTSKVVDGSFEQDADGNWSLPYKLEAHPLADAEANVRSHRGSLLADSDWIVTKSLEAGQAVPADWAAYRQALRDVTAQTGFPYYVIWPTKP